MKSTCSDQVKRRDTLRTARAIASYSLATHGNSISYSPLKYNNQGGSNPAHYHIHTMSQFKNISLDSLEAIAQTRQFFDEEALKELAESIAKQGILQPILVRKVGKKYQIIAGERRFRAAKIAGLSEVPCHVVEMDDNQALEAQITENLQRKDVHPMEEAHAFKRLIDDAKYLSLIHI